MKKYLALPILCLLIVASVSGPAVCDGPKTAPYPGAIVYSGTGEPVIFSHENHVGGQGFSCDACHPEPFVPRTNAAKEKGDFKMSVMQDGEYCGKCHDGSTAFASDDYESCANCHSGTGTEEPATAKVVGPADAITLGEGDTAARFPHASHAAFSCDKCHSGLFPMKTTGTVTNMDAINSGKACGICHNGAVAFDATNCSLCHPKM